MSTNHITPTPGRIVWYRGADAIIRAAIVAFVNGPFNVNLHVFGINPSDTEQGYKEGVTHADPEQEPGCLSSWHWMPYQKQQAEKQANEVARADEPKLASADTSDTAIEREIQAKGKTAPRVMLADIEANIARQNAVQKIWPLMGYQLRDQLHNIATRPADTSGLPG